MTTGWTCRSCGDSHGELVLDLGVQPLANNLLLPEDLEKPEPRFPLRVFVCPACWLLQVTDLVPPVDMFNTYLYFSSFSDGMLQHARNAAERYRADYHLGPQSLVIEIASNDGYLLQNFVSAGVPCLGIEPAVNIAAAARAKGIDTVTEFFGAEMAAALAARRGQADLVLANNVFAHVPDMHGFIRGLRALVRPGGRAVIEFPYAADLVARTEFDTIYHEHVYYLTLSPLVEVFRRHGLEIWDVERTPIHGGSLRMFVGHAGEHPVAAAVGGLLAEEASAGVTGLAYYRDFARTVSQLRTGVRSVLADLKAQGHRIAAYGASAKGSTLLNYCGLGTETIDFVVDRSPHKQGRFTPGTHLPILAPEELEHRAPGVTLLLVWNFATEILEQQHRYRAGGGRFLVPVPAPILI